ncbi:hypothetical protein AB0J90_12535 [Micromonospora sp. NPDC049523]|uniref:hypothetical protein n=1 Tax=Micromonospora sp. NPDC049523 TaxID=3155921 RepID=UPI00343C620F
MTGPTGAEDPRRTARRRAAAAGALLVAYALLLAFVCYLLGIDTAEVLIPVAVALGAGVLGCVPVVVANLRLAAGATGGRWLLLITFLLTGLAVAGLFVVGVFELIAGDAAVGGIAGGAIVLVLGPLVPAALSFSATGRR